MLSPPSSSRGGRTRWTPRNCRPRWTGRSNRNDDFREKVSGRKLPERFVSFLKWENFAHRRPDPVGFDGAIDIFEHRGAADADSVEASAAHHQAVRRLLARRAGEKSNQRDLAAEIQHRVGFRQRPDASDFDDAIHAAPVSDALHFFVPLRVRFVIDGLPRAELAGTIELLVARGCDDHPDTRGFRELKRVHRHAAGAETKDGVAWLDPSTMDHQRRPGSHGRAGQCGGFLERQPRRNRNYALLIERDVLRKRSIERHAERWINANARTLLPDLKERAAYAISRLEPCHLGACRYNLAGAIGQRDRGAIDRREVISGDHHLIAVVQRRRTHADEYLARPWDGLWPLAAAQTCEAGTALEDFVDLHFHESNAGVSA